MRAQKFVDRVFAHRRLVIVLLLVITAGFGFGMTLLEEENTIEGFQTDSTEAEKLDYIQENYAAEEDTTTTQVVIQNENVLDRDSLIETLEFQQALREAETVNETLVDRPMTSVANAVATASIQEEFGDGEQPSPESQQPSLAEQQRQLESMTDSETEQFVESVLDGDNQQLLGLLPAAYEPGDTQATEMVITITQDTDGELVSPDAAPEEIIDAQFEMRSIADDHPSEYIVFGHGITADEIDSSLDDSLAIVGPLALLFVLAVLGIAYRDPLDIALGLFGIITVLVWTLGFMGLAGIEFGLIFIAVPVLLIGLSIDYAIHVFMRGREARSGTDFSVEQATTAGLAGVGLALVLVTITAAIGFLSNVVSPLEPIQQFGLVNAVGIVAALLVFGLLVPALKIEIDSFLEARGIDRRKEAFGKTGRLEPVMRTGERLARRAPVVVLLVVILLTAGGLYGGAQLDSSFSTDQFMADEKPDWTENLPDPLEPQEYTATDTIEYFDETFLRQELQAQILLEGDPTDEQFLKEASTAERETGNLSVAATVPTGDPAVHGPISAMESTAATNESFNQTFLDADTTGDGIPDSDLAQLYDEFFAANPEAAADIIHRTADGNYESARIVMIGDGEFTRGQITEEIQTVAASVDGTEIEATATGEQTVLYDLIEQEILDTVIESLLVTLLVVAVLLAVIYRITAGRASLGLVTTVPVLLALTWVLGTMSLTGISLNSITGMITSLTIGLGVAYSIHVTQRYHQQLRRRDSVWDALRTTVTGTGGALLGSAATTAGGFGVLTLAFVPSLQQFGFITAISIMYAFLASVLVLPTLLVFWTRFFGPAWASDQITGETAVEQTSPGTADDD